MLEHRVDTTEQRATDPALDNQRIFRAILLTMSRPGTVTTLGNLPGHPGGLHPASAAVCMALVDMDSPLWISPDASEDVATHLKFYCGCPVIRKQEECSFGLVLNGLDLPDLERFNPGEAEYPDRSATLIIQVASIEVGHGVRLGGPGINGQTLLNITGLQADFWESMQQNRQRFPLGYDVILTTETEIVSLPRSVQVEI